METTELQATNTLITEWVPTWTNIVQKNWADYSGHMTEASVKQQQCLYQIFKQTAMQKQHINPLF